MSRHFARRAGSEGYRDGSGELLEVFLDDRGVVERNMAIEDRRNLGAWIQFDEVCAVRSPCGARTCWPAIAERDPEARAAAVRHYERGVPNRLGGRDAGQLWGQQVDVAC
jgi:hypothetical protein